jgi:hypothetical protein
MLGHLVDHCRGGQLTSNAANAPKRDILEVEDAAAGGMGDGVGAPGRV